MQELLKHKKISAERMLQDRSGKGPELRAVDGCVLLAEGYSQAKNVTLQQFQDRTGYECFVNHVHFYDGRGKEALERVLDYVAALRQSLLSFREDRFEIIISAAEEGAVVRFHKRRLGESWLSEDLEAYKHEAILTTRV